MAYHFSVSLCDAVSSCANAATRGEKIPACAVGPFAPLVTFEMGWTKILRRFSDWGQEAGTTGFAHPPAVNFKSSARQLKPLGLRPKRGFAAQPPGFAVKPRFGGLKKPNSQQGGTGELNFARWREQKSRF